MKYYFIEAGGCMVEAKNKQNIAVVMGYDNLKELCNELQIETSDIEEITQDDYEENEYYDTF